MKVISKATPRSGRARAHVLLHGESGAGKTTFAVTGGKPIVLCLEPKGEATIPLINPDAIVLVPDSIDDLREISKALRNPSAPETIKAIPGIDKATRIVIDSWTDLTALVGAWLSGGTQLQLQQYGDIQRIAFGVLGMAQAGPLPSVIIARSEVQESGNGIMKVVKVVPAGLGKSVAQLPGRLVATLQAMSVNDQGDVFTVESGPSDCARRSGLPWLKGSWKPSEDGDVDKMLAMIECGPKKTE